MDTCIHIYIHMVLGILWGYYGDVMRISATNNIKMGLSQNGGDPYFNVASDKPWGDMDYPIFRHTQIEIYVTNARHS